MDSGPGLVNQTGCPAGRQNHRNGGVPPTTLRPGEQPQVTSGLATTPKPSNNNANMFPNNFSNISRAVPGAGRGGPTISSVLSGLTDTEQGAGLLGGIDSSLGLGLELSAWDSALPALSELDRGGEPSGLVFSTSIAQESSFGLRPSSPTATAAATGGGGATAATASRQQQQRPHSSLSLGLQMQMQHKSRLCSIGTPSVGDMDSLQNALQAFRENEEIDSKEEVVGLKLRDWGSDAGQGLGGAASGATEGSIGSADGAGGGVARATTSTASLRQRKRKPDRGSGGGRTLPPGRSAESAPQPSALLRVGVSSTPCSIGSYLISEVELSLWLGLCCKDM